MFKVLSIHKTYYQLCTVHSHRDWETGIVKKGRIPILKGISSIEVNSKHSHRQIILCPLRRTWEKQRKRIIKMKCEGCCLNGVQR
jgi:hypothetical protein